MNSDSFVIAMSAFVLSDEAIHFLERRLLRAKKRPRNDGDKFNSLNIRGNYRLPHLV